MELKDELKDEWTAIEAEDEQAAAEKWMKSLEGALATTMERLAAAVGILEEATHKLLERQSDFAVNAEAGIGRIVATVESKREAELEQKLAAAEAEIAELRAVASGGAVYGTSSVTNGRKTLPAGMVSLLAKQGVTMDSLEAGALDAALTGLSIEQRIAVKSQLMRAGLAG